MEYAKDIILDVRCRRKMGVSKLSIWAKRWTSNIVRHISNNKLTFSVLTSLLVLIAIDIALINSFFALITNLWLHWGRFIKVNLSILEQLIIYLAKNI